MCRFDDAEFRKDTASSPSPPPPTPIPTLYRNVTCPYQSRDSSITPLRHGLRYNPCPSPFSPTPFKTLASPYPKTPPTRIYSRTLPHHHSCAFIPDLTRLLTIAPQSDHPSSYLGKHQSSSVRCVGVWRRRSASRTVVYGTIHAHVIPKIRINHLSILSRKAISMYT